MAAEQEINENKVLWLTLALERNNDFFIVKENQIELFASSSFTRVTLPTLRFHCPDRITAKFFVKIQYPIKNIFKSIVEISIGFYLLETLHCQSV